MRRFAYKERERHPWSIHAFKIIQTMPNRKPEEELIKGSHSRGTFRAQSKTSKMEFHLRYCTGF